MKKITHTKAAPKPVQPVTEAVLTARGPVAGARPTAGGTRRLAPEQDITGQMLFRLTGASQAKSRETVLVAEFGQDILNVAHAQGLITKSPKGVFSITLKGRDALREINNLATPRALSIARG